MSHERHQIEPSKGPFLIYAAKDGTVKLDVRFDGETVWLTQPLMAELFQTTQQNINQRILNIYDEAERVPEGTHKKFLSVRKEGNREAKRLSENLAYRLHFSELQRFFFEYSMCGVIQNGGQL